MMSPMSAEASVIRNYLDWMVKIPWKKRTKIKIISTLLKNFECKDHHGLEEVKERILEFLAVQKELKIEGPYFMFGWSSGVGKTRWVSR